MRSTYIKEESKNYTSELIKSKFYEDLNSVIIIVANADKLNILGDFNARFGRDYTAWKDGIGKYSVA